MKTKKCDAIFCTKQTPAKYRYCRNCARDKGIIRDNRIGFFGWMVILILLWAVFG